MNRRDVDLFMRDVELLIPISNRDSKRFLSDMRNSISDYLSCNEDAGREEIVKEFGSPKDIAMDYVESIDTEELIQHISTRQLVRKLIYIAALVAVIMLSIFSYYQYRGYQDLKNSIVVKEEVIIEDGGIP